MRVSEYPYGKVTKTLKKAADYLNKNYIKIIKHELSYQDEITLDDISYMFDYPEYLNIPKTISSRLNSDEVDWLQEGWIELVEKYKNRYE